MRILILFSLLLSWSCTEPTVEPVPRTTPVSPPRPAAAPVSYLALGDSYTIGEGVGEADRWSEQLAQLGQVDGIQKPDIIARTGWTTAELQQAINSANNKKTYGLVSLLIGVNNQYRGQPLATYRTELRQLLQTAARFAGGQPSRVFVLSIPDWGRTPYARSYDQERIATEINQFNAAAKEECQQAGVAFIDITDLTRRAADDPTQFTPDGLHYSGRHMQQWAQRALPVARQLLK
ncbi:SGNH/GDSL hydrolase family protein [Hymenobacter sediminis]|uniref:SGNH/GDSL hydrolase family protein n=1 Tax=Hymenobacter sediminis TaxID=2218621 RepID=UPI000DA69B38|nr:SGNH/GDSL hydrolase family protein [Hymenobacter sediminis]RPD50161.1 SGNH/GDSL hydrolase family protein [Hymenobacter sediminis]